MKHYLLSGSLLLGVAAGLGLLVPLGWVIALAACSYWLAGAYQLTTTKKLMAAGFMFSFGTALVALSFFWSAYPALWLDMKPGLLHVILVAGYWIPAAAGLAVGGAAFGYALAQIRRLVGKRTVLLVPLIALAAVLTEVCGAVAFSAIFAGPHSSLTPGFSFGHLGYTLASHEIILEAARVGGVYALSLLFYIIAAALALTSRVLPRVVIAGMVALTFFGVVTHEPLPALDETVLLVESYIPPTALLTETELEQIKFELVFEAVQTGADTIILPENFGFTTYFDTPEAVFVFLANAANRPVRLIDSATIEAGQDKLLRAFVYDTAAQEVFAFDKQYFTPQGEFTPYVYRPLISALLAPEDRASFLQSYHGEVAQRDLGHSDAVPPVLFCFESVVPFGAQSVSLAHPGAAYIAHPVSHGWFNHSQTLLWNQLDDMLKVQAVWTGVPILQAGNEVSAAVILPHRQEISQEVVAQNEWWSLVMVSW